MFKLKLHPNENVVMQNASSKPHQSSHIPNIKSINPELKSINEYIRKNFKNSKLKKVVNVFQMNYMNDKSQGIGDFFRGSVYLTHLCELLNVRFDIHLLNHPLHICLMNQENEYESMQPDKVYSYIDKTNRRHEFIIDFINVLNACHEEIAYVYFNYDPRFDIEHPNHGIIHHARNIIIPKIQPTESVLSLMDNKLAEISVQRKQYRIIHIRLGDHFMIKRECNHLKRIFQTHMNYIINDIGKRLSQNEKYIIVGDNNIAKNMITRIFNNVHMFNTEIIHLGEKTNLNAMSERSLIDTFVDFCIIRYSRSVVSYSAYGHGSGFSKQCAHLYGVPFQQILLRPQI